MLLAQLHDGTKLPMLRNATWTISNLCRGKPPPSWDLVAVAIPALMRLILSGDDEVRAAAAARRRSPPPPPPPARCRRRAAAAAEAARPPARLPTAAPTRCRC